MRPDICRFSDTETLAFSAAERLEALARAAVAARGRFTLALAGGRTPLALYRLLATEAWQERVPWARAEVFWGDERFVPPDHPASNFRAAHEALLAHVPLPVGQVHPVPSGVPSPEVAARAYEDALRARLAATGPGDAPPAFDLVLLGMGADGHTASLFPGTAALAERERWVTAAEAPADAPPRERVTLTLPVLNAARSVLFLAAGPDKAETLAAILDAPEGEEPAAYPAARVRPTAGQVTWFVAP